MSSLEISKILTVCTGHVSEETYDKLLIDGEKNEIMCPVYTKAAPNGGEDFGLYIYLNPDCVKEGHIPDDLMQLITLAQENDCDILCLDCDGPEVEGLTIYEW